MQPKYEFQPALDYVKLRRNHAEFSRVDMKKIHSAFQSIHWGTAF